MGGKFSKLGNSQIISLPNHLPPLTYLRDLNCQRPSQKGGIGPLTVAGMALAPMLLNPLLSSLQH